MKQRHGILRWIRCARRAWRILLLVQELLVKIDEASHRGHAGLEEAWELPDNVSFG